jgi:putative transposase
MRHPQRDQADQGFVGIDRGLSAWLVAARTDGTELDRRQPPRPLVRALPKIRRASRQASRKQSRSLNRRKADIRLNRIHGRIADQRRYAIHQVTTKLVKTHDRICVEDLAVATSPDPLPMRRGASCAASSLTRPAGMAAG